MWDWFSIDWLSWQTLRSFVWAEKLYLYAIIGIPFLFLFRWLFYTRGQQKLGLSLTTYQLRTNWISYLRFIPPILFILGLICVLLSLARPQRVRESKEQFSEGIDIMLAIDISESMMATDLSPNRLEAAKNVGHEFIKVAASCATQHVNSVLPVFAHRCVGRCRAQQISKHVAQATKLLAQA